MQALKKIVLTSLVAGFAGTLLPGLVLANPTNQTEAFDLDKAFAKSAADVLTLKKHPSNSDKLLIYALYKQATIGDVNISEPSRLNFEAHAKWKEWSAHRGKTQEQAKYAYIDVVKQMIAKYGLR